jgi:hypothetical protein
MPSKPQHSDRGYGQYPSGNKSPTKRWPGKPSSVGGPDDLYNLLCRRQGQRYDVAAIDATGQMFEHDPAFQFGQ